MDALKQPDFQDVQKAAADYIARGLQVVPLAEGTKACVEKDWIKLIFTPADFKPGDNIGIRSVNGLIDIDCDSPEVVEMAPEFLPSTGAVYGRESKPHAHWLYKSKFDKRIAFTDQSVNEEKKGVLIEIRANHQSMAPPSIHPDDKEILYWRNLFGDIADIPDVELLRAVQLLATAGLTGRHYNPQGNRHDWCLALSGFFRQLGITHDECKRVVVAAAKWARDLKLSDRLAEINSTYNHGEDDPLKAAGSLKDLMPKGNVFVKSLNKIWGASSSAFRVDKKGEKILLNDQDNIKLALKKLNVEMSYNLFMQQPFIKYKTYDGPLQDSIANHIWLQIDKQYHFRPQIDFYDKVIKDVAEENPVHPVINYLDSLEWDESPRLDMWLVHYAGAKDTAYTRAVSSIVLIAAVRRIKQPGCKYDELLVLESDQGLLKSSALRALCPNEDWFSDDLPLNLDAKQIIERTTGKWIIEAAELSGLNKAQSEHLKSMLSRQEDGPVRMAYERNTRKQKRQFIIVGTTNAQSYLMDTTGNRRFWPISVDKFNIPGLLKARDQLWAEAAVREAKGESIRLDPKLWAEAERHQTDRYIEDAWEATLREAFDDKDVVRATPEDIWRMLNIPIQFRTGTYQIRVTSIMHKIGFTRGTVLNKDTGKNTRGWVKGKWSRGIPLPLDGNDTIN